MGLLYLLLLINTCFSKYENTSGETLFSSSLHVLLKVQPNIIINFDVGLHILGAFEKNYERLTISFIMSVRLSVRMEQLGSNWTDFLDI